ncbi:hypothetical protein DPEC_G00067690 [Dallia pectoralis]|uniref:Uncharacterized protein n=1 Tax=Dallia pectoralis TaxID=75939 RepID=A0ACC2H1S2_DALPE|nr:hypothetical protein DPEC_G00067690 [Dallia pectoralis]
MCRPDRDYCSERHNPPFALVECIDNNIGLCRHRCPLGRPSLPNTVTAGRRCASVCPAGISWGSNLGKSTWNPRYPFQVLEPNPLWVAELDTLVIQARVTVPLGMYYRYIYRWRRDTLSNHPWLGDKIGVKLSFLHSSEPHPIRKSSPRYSTGY